MHQIDLLVIVIYLVGTVVFGAWFSRSQKDVKDYFVGGRSVPWWAIMGSIVATETSTVTFISVPGVAFTGNWTFLQLVMGYMIGRIAVSIIFVPGLLPRRTADGVPDARAAVRRPASSGLRRDCSSMTRSLADGVRLFATGLVLAALLLAMPGIEDGRAAWVAGAGTRRSPSWWRRCLVMGVTTIIYTYLGGMSAVIWTDVIQLVIYLVGRRRGAGHPARSHSRADGPRSSASAAQPRSSRCSTSRGRHEELHVLVRASSAARF